LANPYPIIQNGYYALRPKKVGVCKKIRILKKSFAIKLAGHPMGKRV
jgi:hypothetical protein